MYWTDEEEILCHKWRTSGTTEQVRIYNRLESKIKYMIESIAGRYFNLKPSQEIGKETALTCAFLALDSLNDGKAYSYLGTSIKRHLINVVNKTELEFETLDKLSIPDETDWYTTITDDMIVDELELMIKVESGLKKRVLTLIKNYYQDNENMKIMDYMNTKSGIGMKSLRQTISKHYNIKGHLN